MLVQITVAAASAGLLFTSVAPADAKTVREYWQVSVQMPAELWEDGANITQITGETDVFTLGSTRYLIRWTNATSSTVRKYMPKMQGGKWGSVTAGLYPKPLSRKTLKRWGLRQRPLWLDADILVAAADSPLCAGMSSAQVQGVLDGSIRDWGAVHPEAAGGSVTVSVVRDYSEDYRPQFGRQKYGSTVQPTTDGQTLSGTGVSAQKFSYAHRALSSGTLCAVPVDGVTPSEQSIRDRSYPYAYTVYYVDRVKPRRGKTGISKAQRIRWEQFLFGDRGREYLLTQGGRQRLLP